MRILWAAVLLLMGSGAAISQRGDKDGGKIHPVTVRQLRDIVLGDSGKIVLLNAWASWCKPCRDEMPGLLRLGREYKDRGLDVILVAIDESEIVDSIDGPLLQKWGVDFPTYYARDSSDDAFILGLNPEWNGALPASFIYNGSGKLLEMMVGGRSYAQLKRKIAKALK